MGVPDLHALDDRAYEQLAVGHAHPKRRAPTPGLSSPAPPQHIERTRAALANGQQRTAATLRRRKTKRDAFQLGCFARGEAGKKEWFATRFEYERWCRGAAGFHQMIQAAVSELAKTQRAHNHRMTTQQSAQAVCEALRKLSIAVQHQQAAHARTGTVAAQEDYELWQLLGQLTVPCGPAREPTMLDFHWADVDVATDVEAKRAAVERVMRQAPAAKSAQFAGVPRARHVGNEKDLAG
ncbi:hypothetical protein SUDANB6_05868 [Streptomyces sp. enrichment culture]|uniref:hypothetical protein n=1 Tax=Streptomyces sp. enrichment culture TaxID=1795815 RepID=UPI003F54A8AB